MTYQPKEQFEIEFKALGSAGEGVGTLPNGMKVFVEGPLPGELVRIQLKKVKKTYALGQIVKILQASPDRIEPDCPVYRKCGGCQVMHLNYPAQLREKTQRVKDAFERIGGFSELEVPECIPSRQQFNYRNKIQLPVSGTSDDFRLGLYARGTHDVIRVENCITQTKVGNEILAQIQNTLSHSKIDPYDEKTGKGILRHVVIRSIQAQGKAIVILVTTGQKSRDIKVLARSIQMTHEKISAVYENLNLRRDNVIMGEDFRLLAGEEKNSSESGALQGEILGLNFQISPASFFQINTAQAENIYPLALDWCALDADPSDKTILDAYCGVGVMTLLAAQRFKQAVGIECVEDAIENAEANSKLNNIKNADFVLGRVENCMDDVPVPDAIILNPPRAGCQRSVLDSILEKDIPNIVYISCNPATQARDAKILADGGYKLDRMQPLDMFPQTMHVENVIRMVKDR